MGNIISKQQFEEYDHEKLNYKNNNKGKVIINTDNSLKKQNSSKSLLIEALCYI